MDDKPKGRHGFMGLGKKRKEDDKKLFTRSLFHRSAREVNTVPASNEAVAKSDVVATDSVQTQGVGSDAVSNQSLPKQAATGPVDTPPTQAATTEQPKSTMNTAAEDPALNDQAVEDPKTLWDKAYARLRREKSELADAYEALLAKTASISEGLPVRETIKAVVDNRVEVMTKREWKVRIPWVQEPMAIRSLVDRIVNVVLKFQDVANVAASVDPIHVGIPVAGISILLTVSDLPPTFQLIRALTAHITVRDWRHPRACLRSARLGYDCRPSRPVLGG
jgi:hypothetical protein